MFGIRVWNHVHDEKAWTFGPFKTYTEARDYIQVAADEYGYDPEILEIVKLDAQGNIISKEN